MTDQNYYIERQLPKKEGTKWIQKVYTYPANGEGRPLKEEDVRLTDAQVAAEYPELINGIKPRKADFSTGDLFRCFIPPEGASPEVIVEYFDMKQEFFSQPIVLAFMGGNQKISISYEGLLGIEADIEALRAKIIVRGDPYLKLKELLQQWKGLVKNDT